MRVAVIGFLFVALSVSATVLFFSNACWAQTAPAPAPSPSLDDLKAADDACARRHLADETMTFKDPDGNLVTRRNAKAMTHRKSQYEAGFEHCDEDHHTYVNAKKESDDAADPKSCGPSCQLRKTSAPARSP